MLPEEKIAHRFLQQRKLQPPIDTESLVKEFAVLEEETLPDSYDAVYLDKSEKRPKPVVIISKHLPPARRVFTLGHEMGHILIPWHIGTHFCSVGAEVRLTDRLVKEVESEANRFAAELLMPAAWIDNLVKSAKSLKELVEAVKEAHVSYIAASIRLSQLSPEGYAFIEIDSEGVIKRVQQSAGTRISMPNKNEPLNQARMDALADDSATFQSGGSKIIWWHFSNKLKSPKTNVIPGDSAQLLQAITTEIFHHEAQRYIMSVNGIIGAANGDFKRNRKGDLFTLLKQRFANRENLAKLVSHPHFDVFLKKRVEELI